MDVYSYNRFTGEYMGVATAFPCQIEKGVFHIPAFATTEAPPAPIAGRAAVFDNGAWTLVEDHRGKTFWKGDVEFVCEWLGPIPPGVSDQPPAGVVQKVTDAVRQTVLAAVAAAFFSRAKPD